MDAGRSGLARRVKQTRPGLKSSVNQ